MKITAENVRELRALTSAGMMDCKRALNEANGDMRRAQEILRIKGQGKSKGKGDRETSEGLVVAALNDDATAGILLVVKCETDFVARNDSFVKFANEVVQCALEQECRSAEELLGVKLRSGLTVEEVRVEKVAELGENITFGQMSYRAVENWDVNSRASVLAEYVHTTGKLGALVELSASSTIPAPESESFQSVGRDLAMHVVAASPLFVSEKDAPAEEVESERRVALGEFRQSGKPEKLAERIVEGKVNKWISTNALLEQTFIKEPIPVSEWLSKMGVELDVTLTVKGFDRAACG